VLFAVVVAVLSAGIVPADIAVVREVGPAAGAALAALRQQAGLTAESVALPFAVAAAYRVLADSSSHPAVGRFASSRLRTQTHLEPLVLALAQQRIVGVAVVEVLRVGLSAVAVFVASGGFAAPEPSVASPFQTSNPYPMAPHLRPFSSLP